MTVVEFRLFGGVALECDGRPVTGRAAHRHPLALLALLAVLPGQSASRDKLIAYLWPEAGTGRARHRLSVALHVLRTALGQDCLTTLSDGVALDPSCIRTDVAAFTDALAEGRLEAAVELYAGPFADGFFVSGSSGFEEWVQHQRNRFAALYGGALERLATEAGDRGDATAAVRWCRLLAAHDPCNVAVALALIQALRSAGDPTGAWRHARAHAALIQGEMGAAPDPRIMAFVEELPEESAREHRERDDPVPAPLPPPPRPGSRWVGPVAAATTAAGAFLAGALVLWGGSGSPDVEERAPAGVDVAVLPFVDDSGLPEEPDLGDRLARDVVATLAYVPNLRPVVGHGPPAGRHLAAGIGMGRAADGDLVVAGSFRRDEHSGSVTVRILHASTGEERWREQLELPFRDPDRFVNEMSLAVADALRLRLAPYEPKIYTESDRAYDRFLQGVDAHRAVTKDGLWKALQLYREGWEEDAGFALAHAIAAEAYVARIGLGLDPAVGFELAREHALEALAIDSTLAEGHTALARVQIWHDWDLAAAERSLRRALMLYPTLPQARTYYGHLLLRIGDSPDAALAHIRRGMELDPLNAVRSHTLEKALLLAGRYSDALAQNRVTRALSPEREFGATAATAYRELERYDRALAEYARVQTRLDGHPPPGLAITYARMGRTDAARALLPDLEARVEAGSLPAEELAAVHGSLGDFDRAFYWLERAYDERSPGLLALRVDPDFDALRGDPRFEALRRRVGLAR